MVRSYAADSEVDFNEDDSLEDCEDDSTEDGDGVYADCGSNRDEGISADWFSTGILYLQFNRDL